MGNFLCGVERVNHFVKVNLHCIVRNLKKDQRNVNVVPPWKNFCGRPWGRALEIHSQYLQTEAQVNPIRLFFNLLYTTTKHPKQVELKAILKVVYLAMDLLPSR